MSSRNSSEKSNIRTVQIILMTFIADRNGHDLNGHKPKGAIPVNTFGSRLTANEKWFQMKIQY
jgi:hypothetical protein